MTIPHLLEMSILIYLVDNPFISSYVRYMSHMSFNTYLYGVSVHVYFIFLQNTKCRNLVCVCVCVQPPHQPQSGSVASQSMT